MAAEWTSTPYGRVQVESARYTLSASPAELRAWVKSWPDSYLQHVPTSLTVVFEARGLVAVSVAGAEGIDFLTVLEDPEELRAWAADVLTAAGVSQDHPAWLGAAGSSDPGAED